MKLRELNKLIKEKEDSYHNRAQKINDSFKVRKRNVLIELDKLRTNAVVLVYEIRNKDVELAKLKELQTAMRKKEGTNK